jgi:hypothetical protein
MVVRVGVPRYATRSAKPMTGRPSAAHLAAFFVFTRFDGSVGAAGNARLALAA